MKNIYYFRSPSLTKENMSMGLYLMQVKPLRKSLQVSKKELDRFADDYAYVFQSDLDKVRYRIEEPETYERYKTEFIAEVEKQGRQNEFKVYQELTKN